MTHQAFVLVQGVLFVADVTFEGLHHLGIERPDRHAIKGGDLGILLWFGPQL
ncbi:MAG: hypothetical protein ACLPVY_13565 [Acidimicrobiia bacterium]